MKNGKDTPLSRIGSSMPNVNDAILSWFQALTFNLVKKTIDNFQVTETLTPISFRGVIQPYTAQQLVLRPEGQRGWRWHTLHADPSLALNIDDVVTYLGVNYRVKDKTDYTAYGYIEYHLIEDYQ